MPPRSQAKKSAAPATGGVRKPPRRKELQQELARACLYGKVRKVAELLTKLDGMKKGAVNAIDETGEAPLHVACRGGHVEVVTALIAANADVDKVTYLLDRKSVGNTPLCVACFYGRTDIVATLLAANADVNQARADAGSAAHAVLEWGAPWSRMTNKFYPPKVRERVQELMLVSQWLKRRQQVYFPIPFEVWGTGSLRPTPGIVKAAVASDMWG